MRRIDKMLDEIRKLDDDQLVQFINEKTDIGDIICKEIHKTPEGCPCPVEDDVTWEGYCRECVKKCLLEEV